MNSRSVATKRVKFKNDRGLKLSGILDYPVYVEKKFPAVVICPHFTGFKEIKHYYNLAKILTMNGFVALRFDFSDCIGESEGSCEDMMLTHQVRDVFSALDFMEKQYIVDPMRLGIIGHSLGGTTAIVAAAKDNRIRALVVVAPARADIFGSKLIEEWRKDGYMTFRTYKRGEIRVKWSFYEDLKKYELTRLVKKVRCPLRIIHGSADELFDIEAAKILYANANKPKDLKVIEGADHFFNDEKYGEQMIDLTVEWFKEKL